MALPLRAGHAGHLDPLDALAAAADALYTTRDEAAALEAIGAAEEALGLIPRSAERADAACSLATARVAVETRSLPAVRAAANRVYEAAIVLLEPAGPGARVHLMLVRLLLRRALEAASGTGSHRPDRLLRCARGASRAIALQTERGVSPLQAALEQLLARAEDAARADDPAAVCESVQRALSLVDALEDERAGGSSAPAMGHAGGSAPFPP